MSRDEPFPSWLALLIAIACLWAGVQLMAGGGRNPVGAGVLLLVGSLAFTALALAQGAYGPDEEGPLDLSARLGLGLLGGLLAALAVRLALRLSVGLGVFGFLGIRLSTWQDAIALGLSPGAAVFAGVAFGILYPYIPGREFPGKGALAGLLAAVLVLLRGLPVGGDAGWLEVAFGPFAFLAVVLFGLVWGLTCAATLAWGARGDEAPVSRYLG